MKHLGKAVLTAMVVAACVAVTPTMASASPASVETLEAQLEAVSTSTVADTAANERRAIAISESLLKAESPEIFFNGLSESEKAIFTAYSMQATTTTSVKYIPKDAEARASMAAGVTPEQEFGISAVGCWGSSATSGGKNVFGAQLYTLRLEAGWCSSGRTVTRAYRNSSTGQTFWIGWVHQGRIGGQSGIVSNQGRTWVQHRFTYGAGGWNVQTRDTCLRLRGYSTGVAYSDLTCGLY